MNEKGRGLKKADRFEEWTPGDGTRAVLLSPRERGLPYRSSNSSVAETIKANGGLKVGGLVKKVSDSSGP
jgi:hypothetical protein